MKKLTDYGPKDHFAAFEEENNIVWDSSITIQSDKIYAQAQGITSPALKIRAMSEDNII